MPDIIGYCFLEFFNSTACTMIRASHIENGQPSEPVLIQDLLSMARKGRREHGALGSIVPPPRHFLRGVPRDSQSVSTLFRRSSFSWNAKWGVVQCRGVAVFRFSELKVQIGPVPVVLISKLEKSRYSWNSE
jgi:hypothetical protein